MRIPFDFELKLLTDENNNNFARPQGAGYSP